jgi:hypothetical protein
MTRPEIAPPAEIHQATEEEHAEMSARFNLFRDIVLVTVGGIIGVAVFGWLA